MSSDLGEIKDARLTVNNSIVVSIGAGVVQLTIYNRIITKGEIFLDREGYRKFCDALWAAGSEMFP